MTTCCSAPVAAWGTSPASGAPADRASSWPGRPARADRLAAGLHLSARHLPLCGVPACREQQHRGRGWLSGRRNPRIQRRLSAGSAEAPPQAGPDWNIDERLRLGTSVLAYSSQYVRGNENNRHRANDEFEGRGRLPGYAVVNLTADYRLARDWTLFGRVDNPSTALRHRRSAGREPVRGAGNAFESDPDEWRHEQFIAPGAPRAGWLGVRYRWDAL